LLAATATFAELAVLSLAVYVLLKRGDRTAAEAAACALLLPLVFLSAVFQAAFLAGLPAAAIPVELAALAASAAAIRRYRRDLPPIGSLLRAGLFAHPFLAAASGAVFFYLLLQALVVPPAATSWGDLAPMAYLEIAGTFFPPPPAAGPGINPLGGAVNHSILFHLMLRVGTDRGLGLLGFFSYLSIGFSTYALARRYAWPPTALTAALVVMSLPRLVVQASGPGAELMGAAAALLAIVSLYRLIEHPNTIDLYLLMLLLFFSISGRQMSLAAPLVLGALSALLLYRRHGGRIWRSLLIENRVLALSALLPALLLSQLWLVIARAGPEGAALASMGPAPNPGGLAGALANLIRYGLESIHLTLPAEQLGRWMFGASPIRILGGVYHWAVAPFLGKAGATDPFVIRWLPDGTLSWFGPFGFFLVVPAIAYALYRGPRRIKAVALALVVYGYLVALVPAWQAGNAGYFTFFFVCGGFSTAFFLPPWRLTKTGMHLLQAMSLGLLIYAASMNAEKPLIGYAGWLESLYPGDPIVSSRPVLQRTRQSVWARAAQEACRFAECQSLFGDDRIQRLVELIQPDRPVGVFAVHPERAYPLLLHWRSRRIVPLPEAISPSALRTIGLGYLLYLDSLPETGQVQPGLREIWRSKGPEALPGALFFIDPDRIMHAQHPGGRPPAGPSLPPGRHQPSDGGGSARMPLRKISKPSSRVGLRKSLRLSRMFLLASHRTIPEKSDHRMSLMATGWRSINRPVSIPSSNREVMMPMAFFESRLISAIRSADRFFRVSLD
jgi:hypothetical protein